MIPRSSIALLAGVATIPLIRASVSRRRQRAVVRMNLDTPRALAQALPAALYRLTVVVPAYREPRIAQTVERLRRALVAVAADGGVEIVVVDDGSGDDTADLARRAGADQVLQLRQNQGKGAAVRAGMLVARGRTVAFTDADLSYSPDQIVRLLLTVEDGWDVAVGSRDHPDATIAIATSRLRRFGHGAIRGATRLVLIGRHTDTQCGLKAFRRDVALRLFGQSRIDRFAFDIELLHLVERCGFSVCEVPVVLENSTTSTVRVGRDTVRLARDLVRIRWWAQRGVYDARPGPTEHGRPRASRATQPDQTAAERGPVAQCSPLRAPPVDRRMPARLVQHR